MFNHGGARVGAGRKAHLQDKTAETIIRLSASTIIHALRDKNLAIELRADIAKHFVLKAIPQASDEESNLRGLIYIVNGERAGKLGENKQQVLSAFESTEDIKLP